MACLPGRNVGWVHPSVVHCTILVVLFNHSLPGSIEFVLYVDVLIIYHAQVQMLQLRKAVLEKDILCLNQFLSQVAALLKCDWWRLVLQTSHLKCFHDDFILSCDWACLTVSVEADNTHCLWFVWLIGSPLNFVFDRYLSSGSQLLYELSGCLGLVHRIVQLPFRLRWANRGSDALRVLIPRRESWSLLCLRSNDIKCLVIFDLQIIKSFIQVLIVLCVWKSHQVKLLLVMFVLSIKGVV